MEHYYENIQGWFNFQGFYSEMVKRFPNGHFVEVGCWLGKSTCYMGVEILNSNNPITFNAVDTWEGSLTDKDDDKDLHISLMSELPKTIYETFLDNIEPIKDIVKPIRLPSIEASKIFRDSSLDFVYIDANHQYEEVLKDIKHWLPKVKSGGVLAGHDYDHIWLGVVKAVDESFGNNIRLIDNTWVYEKK